MIVNAVVDLAVTIIVSLTVAQAVVTAIATIGFIAYLSVFSGYVFAARLSLVAKEAHDAVENNKNIRLKLDKLTSIDIKMKNKSA